MTLREDLASSRALLRISMEQRQAATVAAGKVELIKDKAHDLLNEAQISYDSALKAFDAANKVVTGADLVIKSARFQVMALEERMQQRGIPVPASGKEHEEVVDEVGHNVTGKEAPHGEGVASSHDDQYETIVVEPEPTAKEVKTVRIAQVGKRNLCVDLDDQNPAHKRINARAQARHAATLASGAASGASGASVSSSSYQYSSDWWNRKTSDTDSTTSTCAYKTSISDEWK